MNCSSSPVSQRKGKLGLLLKSASFGAFKEDERLCVVECLREYEKKTLEFWNQCTEAPDPLFFSYVRPHKQSPHRELPTGLKIYYSWQGRSGHSSVFSHSVRGASTSTVVAKGIHVADILAVAEWNRDSTFKTFYYCPFSEDDFA